MKAIVITVLMALLSACHTAPVKCDGHLTAINPAPRAAAVVSDAKLGATASNDKGPQR